MLTVHEQFNGRRGSIDESNVKRRVHRIAQFSADRDRATKRLVFEGKGLKLEAAVLITVLLFPLMLVVVVLFTFLVVMMHFANHSFSLNIIPAGTKVDIKTCSFKTSKYTECRFARLDRLHKGFLAENSDFFCDLVQY